MHGEGKDMDHGSHHENVESGMCGCGCRVKRPLSREEKIKMLEEHKAALKAELEEVEESINKLKAA